MLPTSSIRALTVATATLSAKSYTLPMLALTGSSAIFRHRPFSSSSTTQAGLRPRGPGPLPLESAADQAEFEKLVKEAENTPATNHPDAQTPVPDEFQGDTNPTTGEIGGPKREPVRFGDWSFKGKVTDF
ncbi:putative mitochondrial protein, conserved [Podila epigama]|nr:putative mitochondrial protein, conserved [Podila epigama]